MQVHYNIDQLPLFRNAVVTIGTFDGVHSGHRKILDQLKTEAAKIKGETVIITFHPHPRKVVQAGKSPVLLINTIDEKISLLDQAGIDHLVVVPFTDAFSQLSAREYVEEFLIKRFSPHSVIIGYDHHFGKGRGGNYRLLEEYESAHAFKLHEIPEHIIHQNIVSSTTIRQALRDGDISIANELLGYDFFFQGLVVEGNKLGRAIGYPTANLEIQSEEKIIPGDGVYAVRLVLFNHHLIPADSFPFGNRNPVKYLNSTFENSLQGMMNIGTRPTVGGTKVVMEVNIFDFDEVIYGQILQVVVKKFIRKEEKFAGLDALKHQLGQDKKQVIQVLRRG